MFRTGAVCQVKGVGMYKFGFSLPTSAAEADFVMSACPRRLIGQIYGHFNTGNLHDSI